MNKKIKRIQCIMLTCALLTIFAFPSFVSAEEEVRTETIYTTACWLNIRETAGVENEPIDCVPYNTELQMVNKGIDGWVVIDYNGKAAYVSEDYISTEKQDEEGGNIMSTSASYEYSPAQFMNLGIIYWGDFRWTWYSENVLPGGGLNIPGRHTNDLGYVCDGDGYICLASNDYSNGTIFDTPFGGQGKIYDSGCDSGTLDVYVSW